MNRILILIPDEFNSFSKFERKVRRITKSLSDYSVIFPRDENGLIERLFGNGNNIQLSYDEDWDIDSITHAIVFDDGEVFIDDLARLRDKEIPTRLINVKITRVINIKNEVAYKGVNSTNDYEYIGRGSYWGNPHSMYEAGEDREEVIRKYRYDFEYDKFIKLDKSKVYELAGKRLGCFCKPAACHGDVLAEFLNSWDDGK